MVAHPATWAGWGTSPGAKPAPKPPAKVSASAETPDSRDANRRALAPGRNSSLLCDLGEGLMAAGRWGECGKGCGGGWEGPCIPACERKIGKIAPRKFANWRKSRESPQTWCNLVLRESSALPGER